jgi:hypothetical protein
MLRKNPSSHVIRSLHIPSTQIPQRRTGIRRAQPAHNQINCTTHNVGIRNYKRMPCSPKNLMRRIVFVGRENAVFVGLSVASSRLDQFNCELRYCIARIIRNGVSKKKHGAQQFNYYGSYEENVAVRRKAGF